MAVIRRESFERLQGIEHFHFLSSLQMAMVATGIALLRNPPKQPGCARTETHARSTPIPGDWIPASDLRPDQLILPGHTETSETVVSRYHDPVCGDRGAKLRLPLKCCRQS